MSIASVKKESKHFNTNDINSRHKNPYIQKTAHQPIEIYSDQIKINTFHVKY
jgi:hypothetical protein